MKRSWKLKLILLFIIGMWVLKRIVPGLAPLPSSEATASLITTLLAVCGLDQSISLGATTLLGQGEAGESVSRADWVAHLPQVLFYTGVIVLIDGVVIYNVVRKLRAGHAAAVTVETAKQ